MDGEIDTERFIKEVRDRPLLWDISKEEYRDRSKTKEAWASIVLTIAPWLENGKKKEEFAKELQLKWRNLRDAFMRAVRNSNASRGATRQKKKYRYAQQMEFLMKTILSRAESIGTVKGMAGMDDDQLEKNMLIQVKNEDNSNSTDMLRADEKLEEKMEFSNTNLQTISYQDIDDDMCFFQSLIPTLRMLNPHQKFTFRINVMGLLQQQISGTVRESQ